MRDGAGENRQRGLLLAGAPQTGRVKGVTPPSESNQHQEEEKTVSTIPGRKGSSGEEEGSLLLFLLRLRTEVSGLKREVREQAGLWFPS